jgi:hypothetical protein
VTATLRQVLPRMPPRYRFLPGYHSALERVAAHGR